MLPSCREKSLTNSRVVVTAVGIDAGEEADCRLSIQAIETLKTSGSLTEQAENATKVYDIEAPSVAGALQSFVTRTGRPCGRAGVSVSIRRLCRDAQVPPEKGNPRCLRKLYYTTRAEIEATVAQLVEQTHERLLEAEQAAVGWGGCQEVRGA